MQANDQQYYINRAQTARRLAQAARNPDIGAIHAKMAVEYEMLAKGRSSLRSGVVARA